MAGTWACSRPNPISAQPADDRQAGHRPSDALLESRNNNDFHCSAFQFGILDDSLNPIALAKTRL